MAVREATPGGTVFLCCTDHRRAALQEQPSLNGIDYLEVGDLEPGDVSGAETTELNALLPADRAERLAQRRLTIAFVNPLLPAHLSTLSEANLRVEGAERPDTRSIAVTVLRTTASSIVLRASRRGDFSPYRLRIVRSADDDRPPETFDPLLTGVGFSFRLDCLTGFDCLAPAACPPANRPDIDLDYLARDYATFRRLILDRIATLSPDWRERHAADLGIALVELVAYVADSLSYRQDAVATEAYLGTARKRVSVRRHARLVDYPMHDGRNARAWLQIVLQAGAPASGVTLPHEDATGATTKFLTMVSAPPTLDEEQAAELLAAERPEVFELVLPPGAPPPRLRRQHNLLPFYTWGASDCCLPAGARAATLAGKFPNLAIGDVLVFEELVGPTTGQAGDADPSHRHAVRLTAVRPADDPLGGRFLSPQTADPVDVTEIAWADEDALPFPLCLSATIENPDRTTRSIAVSCALGNIVLVDHGRTVGPEPLGVVPRPRLALVPTTTAGGCETDEPRAVPARFRPQLREGPLTQCGTVLKTIPGGGRPKRERWPFDPDAPASSALEASLTDVVPRVALEGSLEGVTSSWSASADLLRSSGNDRDFVVEVESDGTSSLRFGDGTNGARPAARTSFAATYRVGNGSRGNVGAGAIAHVVTSVAGIDHVRNPLPSSGGIDPEASEDVRRFAPVAFRTQERAVTADDYARRAERDVRVQQAAASFRWTGSWRTVFVTVDPVADQPSRSSIGGQLPRDLIGRLEAYRMAGIDLEVDTPRYVPLEIEMEVCAKRDYFRADIRRAIGELFDSRVLADGRRGLFHPDNFTFGEPLYLSRLYAAAYAVDGVESVAITTFQRQGQPDPKPLEEGRLDFGRLEIGQLDNDPSLADHGVFRLHVSGGK